MCARLPGHGRPCFSGGPGWWHAFPGVVLRFGAPRSFWAWPRVLLVGGVGVGGAPACVTVAIGPRVVADDPRRTGKVGPFYGAQCFTKARVQPWWARTLSRCARAALGRGRRAAVCVRGIGEQLARSVAPQRRSSNAILVGVLSIGRWPRGGANRGQRRDVVGPQLRGVGGWRQCALVFPDMAAVLQRRAWVVTRLPGCGPAGWGAAQLGRC